MFSIQDGREHFWQWDSNRKLIVEDSSISEVHFSNRTDDYSLVCETYVEDGITLVNVPNILLQKAWRIHAYAFDGNYTKHENCYEVIARTKPADYAYTETEVLNWETINTKVEKALEQTGYYVPTVDASGNLSWEGSKETLPKVKTTNIKGDKGDTGAAFTYDMFTEEQLAALKGPKGDKGDKGDTGPQGEPGADYTLTANDKTEIANLVLAALPSSEEVSY